MHSRRLVKRQKSVLIDLIGQHHQLLLGTTSAQRRERAQKWAELTEELNAMPCGSRKPKKEWRRCFTQMRTKVAEKLQMLADNRRPLISELDQRIAVMLYRDSPEYSDIVHSIIPNSCGVLEYTHSRLSNDRKIPALTVTSLQNDQKKRLVDIMEEEYEFLYGSDPRAHRKRVDKWTEISAELNAMSMGKPHEGSDWRDCFTNMRLALEEKLQSIRRMFQRGQSLGMVMLSEYDLKIVRICYPLQLDEIREWEAKAPSITGKHKLPPRVLPPCEKRPQIGAVTRADIRTYSRASAVPKDYDPFKDLAGNSGSESVRIKSERFDWDTSYEINTIDPASLCLDPAETLLVPAFQSVGTNEANRASTVSSRCKKQARVGAVTRAKIRTSSRAKPVLKNTVPFKDLAESSESDFVHIKTEPGDWDTSYEVQPSFNTIDPASLCVDSAETLLVPKFNPVGTNEATGASSQCEKQPQIEVVTQAKIRTYSRAKPVPKDTVPSKDLTRNSESEFVHIKTEPDDWDTTAEIEPSFNTNNPGSLCLGSAETVLVPEFYAVETNVANGASLESSDPLDLGDPDSKEPEHKVLRKIGRRLKVKQIELIRKRKLAVLQYNEAMQAMRERQTELEAIVFGRGRED